MGNTKAVLVAETEWDLHQLIAHTGLDATNVAVFYTNNYYEKSFRKSKFLRFIALLFIILRVYLKKSFDRGLTVYVADLNFEGRFICNIPKLVDFIFIPNVIIWNQTKEREQTLAPYAKEKRIIFSDQISHYLCYGTTASDLPSLESLPAIKSSRSKMFLVVLPSVFSHKHTKKFAEQIINELLSLANDIEKRGNKVLVATHPRESAMQNNLIDKKCNAQRFNPEIHSGSEIVYISFYSSVSINKKYGPGLGYWISFDEYIDISAGYQILRTFSVSRQEFINAI